MPALARVTRKSGVRHLPRARRRRGQRGPRANVWPRCADRPASSTRPYARASRRPYSRAQKRQAPFGRRARHPADRPQQTDRRAAVHTRRRPFCARPSPTVDRECSVVAGDAMHQRIKILAQNGRTAGRSGGHQPSTLDIALVTLRPRHAAPPPGRIACRIQRASPRARASCGSMPACRGVITRRGPRRTTWTACWMRFSRSVNRCWRGTESSNRTRQSCRQMGRRACWRHGRKPRNLHHSKSWTLSMQGRGQCRRRFAR